MESGFIRWTYTDGFAAELSENDAGWCVELVAPQGARRWRGQRASIDDAVVLAGRMLIEQRAAMVPPD